MPNLNDYMRAVRETPVPPGPDSALNTAVIEALRTHEQAPAQHRRRVHVSRWVATAAVIVIGVGLYLWRGTVPLESLALADVTQRALDTRTVTFQFREHWGTAHVMLRVGDGMRLESDTGEVMIVDHNSGRTLMLDAREQSARIMPAKDWTTFNIYDWLRYLPSDTSKPLGERDIEGKPALGFRVRAPIPASNGTHSGEFIVWADPQSGLPVHIDRVDDGGDEQAIAWDLCFDVPLNDALFDLAVPDGYTLESSIAVANDSSAQPGDAVDERRRSTKVRSAAIGQSVADFVDEDDFSTPMAAYANINRALVAGTNNAWARVSASSMQDLFPRSDEPAYTITPERAAIWLNAEIIEVRYCGKNKAAVIAEFDKPVNELRFDLRWMFRENGRWLNIGQTFFATADEARQNFDSRCQ